MPKYLWKASYTKEGVAGVMSKGGSSRRDAVEQTVTAAGGRMESFYFAFGEADVYVIAELPDDATALAVSMAVNSQGATRLTTVPLLTPEDVDAAAQKSVDYQPPGS
jgi:uncharacterized protein with GYD domain